MKPQACRANFDARAFQFSIAMPNPYPVVFWPDGTGHTPTDGSKGYYSLSNGRIHVFEGDWVVMTHPAEIPFLIFKDSDFRRLFTITRPPLFDEVDGVFVVSGTLLPVAELRRLIEAHNRNDEIIATYPKVTAEHIQAARDTPRGAKLPL